MRRIQHGFNVHGVKNKLKTNSKYVDGPLIESIRAQINQFQRYGQGTCEDAMFLHKILERTSVGELLCADDSYTIRTILNWKPKIDKRLLKRIHLIMTIDELRHSERTHCVLLKKQVMKMMKPKNGLIDEFERIEKVYNSQRFTPRLRDKELINWINTLELFDSRDEIGFAELKAFKESGYTTVYGWYVIKEFVKDGWEQTNNAKKKIGKIVTHLPPWAIDSKNTCLFVDVLGTIVQRNKWKIVCLVVFSNGQTGQVDFAELV